MDIPITILSIEGNIGSGKSTVINTLKEYYKSSDKSSNKVYFLEEPVSEWVEFKDSDGKNIIEKFYEDQEHYSFSFQMMAYISRLALFRKAISENYDIIITERSMFTDKNVFAKMLYDSGNMRCIDYQIYNKWFDEFVDIIKNMKIVYIRTSPEICNKRIIKRARLGENIPINYLQDCHYYHEIWLSDPEFMEKGNVLVINGNEETNTSLFIENSYYDSIIDKVYNFIS